ncbi:MAG: excalibur calcium-binding domain-containing protein [Gordonia sp. (in: high G+C Gram-positive bacteria)]|uniref:excalibur calcium-binding domain-containing protein n=1 Tax=Gordonia sp. (in: high G+C Gram-positive bacteria) TaxID=84139 RepID=UPI0039E31595
MKKTISLLAGSLILGGTLAVVAPAPAADAAPTRYRNCAAMQKQYPHGVGRPGARDKTRSRPVTTFRVNRALYERNTHLDRDKDGIACEKR